MADNTAPHSKSVMFMIFVLAVVGVYEAFSIPIAVFPATNFPRIIIGVDNGVMPINQMEVTITRPLENAVNSVPGLEDVRSVTSRGGQQPEFQITPDTARMQKSRVALQDILDAANHTNLIDSPGLLTRNHQLFLGLVNSQVHSPDEIGDMVIKNVNDVPVRVRDIATVAPSSAPNFTVVTANGKPAVLLSINRQPESNTVEVANLVHQEIENIRPTLPAGVEMRVFYDQSNIVKESIASVRDAIIIGLFL